MRRSAKTIANLSHHIEVCEAQYRTLARWTRHELPFPGAIFVGAEDELCSLARAVVVTRIQLIHGVNVRDALRMEQET